jgi:hypothetical protein
MSAMRKLRLTVPFHSDESPMSFVSRLAAWNGIAAQRFCVSFGLRLRDVVDGVEATLHTLATLGGAEPGRLLANAFSKCGQVQWSHRGEILHRTVLRRERIAICPACALADIEASPQVVPEAAAYGRTPWLLDIVHVCPIHRVPLAYSDETRSNLLHDFAQHAKCLLPRLPELAAIPAQEPGSLQTYVLRRLDGASDVPLLDSMQLAHVVRLCEAAGAAAFLPGFASRKLTSSQRLVARDRGYDAVAGGPDTLIPFLEELKETVHCRARHDGPKSVLRGLYRLLGETLDDPEFETIRELVRDYIVQNFAFESGRQVLGRAIEKRTLHSIQTLAHESSVHPKVLRKHLRAAGLVTDAQMHRSDHNVVFDADAGAAVAAPLAGALSLAEAMQHLNAPRAQMSVLVENGFVLPRHRAAIAGGQDRYAVADLDEFLVKLGIRSPTARSYKCQRLRNIPDTAKQCCRPAAEVIKLILDGRLETKRAPGCIHGYLSILVDPDAAARELRGADNGGLSLREAARRIETSDRVLDALLATGHLASFVARNAVNRCPQKLVAAEEIEFFRSKYVSLWALSKQHGLHIATMKAELEKAGIKPAFDPKKIGATFYRSADVRDHS